MVEKRARKVAQASPVLESGAETAEGGNVDQIRDILFGSQMKDYEKKFSHLENRILKEVTRLRDESSRRLESLEAFIKAEVESLDDRLKAEKASRDEAVEEMGTELASAARSFDKKLDVLESNADKNLRGSRQALLDQSKTLMDEIANRHDQGMEIVDQFVSELKAEKVDRAALSGLLTEVAIRLADTSGEE